MLPSFTGRVNGHSAYIYAQKTSHCQSCNISSASYYPGEKMIRWLAEKHFSPKYYHIRARYPPSPRFLILNYCNSRTYIRNLQAHALFSNLQNSAIIKSALGPVRKRPTYTHVASLYEYSCATPRSDNLSNNTTISV